MKKIQRYFVALLAAQMLLVVSCKQEEIPTLDAGAIPEASTYDSNIKISIDPATNQVTFALEGAQGVYPIWIFDGTTYSTTNGLQKIYAVSGDYSVDVKIGNSNGISDGVISKTFHIDNTIMDFTKYYTLLCKDGKKWHIDGETAGHMGCGEPGTTGNGWWSAPVNDKKDWGVYDNILTFTHGDEGDTYTFDPGESGTVYVNKDVTVWPDLRNPDADFNVPAQLQTVNYELVVEGNDLYIVFPEHTFFPYIANNDIWETPRYRIECITAKQLDLVIDNGNIAWHYILSSGEVKKTFNGFNYKHDANLWKPVDDGSAFEIVSMYYAHGGDWAAYPDGSMTYEQDGPKWTVNLPFQSDQQWQAQFHIQPTLGLALSAATNYDFSCIINSTTDIAGVTIKLTDNTDDGNFLFAERIDVKAYEDVIFWRSDLAGIDAANTKLVFDFGGCPENTVVTLSNITLKDHAVDDGTVLPDDNPEEPVNPEEGAHYDIAGTTNLWRNSGEVGVTFWYSPADWSGGLTPEFEWQGYDFRVVMPEGIGGNEWQGQTHFTINAPVYADKLYDFCATINSGADCVCTVKLAWEGNDNDNSFFYVNDVQLKAFEDVPFKMPKIAPNVDYDKVALFFDFGRTPAGTEVVVKDVCLQEHQEPNGGGGDSEGENLWPAAEVNYGFWYANSGWGQIDNPQWEPLAGNGIRVVIPEGIGGSEWQGQTQFHTNIPVSADKTYNFSMDVDADADMVITVKLAWEGNDNDHAFFYVNDFQVNAYETATFTMKGVSPDVDYDACVLFVDLGRSPAGSTVELKNIKLAEAGGGAAPTPQGTQLWDPEKVTFTYWYSAGDWSGQLAPDIMWDPSKESVVLTMPEGIGGSEWQGQSHFTLDAPVYAAKKYDFGITINSSTDCVCTVKLAWEGNDNENFFFYKNDVQLSAYEDVRFEQLGIAPNVDYDKVALFVDLGRTPAGSEVTISGFSLIEY